MKSITFLLCLALLGMSANAQDKNIDEARVKRLLKTSLKTRKEISKSLSGREIASIQEQEKALHAQFEKLMDKNEDKDYFKEIDQLVSE